MRQVAVWAAGCALAGLTALLAPSAAAAPYVSCPGGYIAPALADCPVIAKSRLEHPPPPTGGGPRRSGLLGLGIGGIL